MIEIQHIQKLMSEWVKVPTLTPTQLSLVQSFRDVAAKGNMMEFLIFKDHLMLQYPDDIIQAIIKARAEGLGAKEY